MRVKFGYFYLLMVLSATYMYDSCCLFCASVCGA